MNLVSTRVNSIESNTQSKEFETNLKKLSFLLNPMSNPTESNSFRTTFNLFQSASNNNFNSNESEI